MKNITVSVDDETYRQSRIKAAEAGTSVSALVRSYLSSLASVRVTGTEANRLERLQEKVMRNVRTRNAGLDPSENLSRQDLHNRNPPVSG